MIAARFREIWSRRKYGDIPKDAMTPEEVQLVNKRWATMAGDTCWMDAFHAEWRATDPAGHAAQFNRTFYESAATMRADDDEDGDS